MASDAAVAAAQRALREAEVILVASRMMHTEGDSIRPSDDCPACEVLWLVRLAGAELAS